MKKYLKDLEAELKKLKISKEDIAEILEDHKEMLNEATAEGVSDDEIALKFGDPEKLAKELYKDVLAEKMTKKIEPVFGTENLKDYELINSFPTIEDLKSVNISLISEDLIYFPHEGESIEVYVIGKYREEDYTINFKEGTFNLLKSKRGSSGIFFSKKTPDFGVRVPTGQLEQFKLNLISGDAELDEINANTMKLKTVSGDIEATNLTSSNNIEVSVVSGDVELQSVVAQGLEMTMVSGDLELRQANFDESIYVNTVSGDVECKDVKVSEIQFKTVSGDFEGEEVVLICVLKGACMFLSDLMKRITTIVTIDFMAVSSYGNALQSSGVVKIQKDLDINAKKHWEYLKALQTVLGKES